MAKTHLLMHMRNYGLCTRATFIKEEHEVSMNALVFRPDKTHLQEITHEQVEFRNVFGDRAYQAPWDIDFEDSDDDDEIIG